MITTVKIVAAHAKALYWKSRMEKAEKAMRVHLETLATLGSGKHETEHGIFQVSENNAYPKEAIMSQLTEAQRALCYEPKWSNERARILYPLEYAAAQDRRGYKVSI